MAGDSCGGVAKGGGRGGRVPGDGAGKGEEGPRGQVEKRDCLHFSAARTDGDESRMGGRPDIKAPQSKENLNWNGGSGKPQVEHWH